MITQIILWFAWEINWTCFQVSFDFIASSFVSWFYFGSSSCKSKICKYRWRSAVSQCDCKGALFDCCQSQSNIYCTWNVFCACSLDDCISLCPASFPGSCRLTLDCFCLNHGLLLHQRQRIFSEIWSFDRQPTCHQMAQWPIFTIRYYLYLIVVIFSFNFDENYQNTLLRYR